MKEQIINIRLLATGDATMATFVLTDKSGKGMATAGIIECMRKYLDNMEKEVKKDVGTKV